MFYQKCVCDAEYHYKVYICQNYTVLSRANAVKVNKFTKEIETMVTNDIDVGSCNNIFESWDYTSLVNVSMCYD